MSKKDHLFHFFFLFHFAALINCSECHRQTEVIAIGAVDNQRATPDANAGADDAISVCKCIWQEPREYEIIIITIYIIIIYKYNIILLLLYYFILMM